MPKPRINIVWFKRDLRLRDHAPLKAAIDSGLPTLLLYSFEPRVMAQPQMSERHWRFVWQSLQDMNRRLEKYGQQVVIFHAEMISVLLEVLKSYKIKYLFSHMEIGLKATFDRDKAVKTFCNNNDIKYQEFAQDGVLRGKKNREGWKTFAEANFRNAVIDVPLAKLEGVGDRSVLKTFKKLEKHHPLSIDIKTNSPNFQKGEKP